MKSFTVHLLHGARVKGCFSLYINEVRGLLLAGVTANFLLSQMRSTAQMSKEEWVTWSPHWALAYCPGRLT